MLGDQEFQDTQQHAKELHRVVHQQTIARKGLQKVRQARRNYVSSWAAYTDQLAQMLDRQLQEQDKAIQSFAEAEAKWSKQLSDATTSLVTLSGGAQHVPSDSEDMETEKSKPGDAEEDPWKAAEVAEELKQRQKQLTIALNQARDSAAAAAKDSTRDTSRTPRRTAKDEGEGAAAHPQKAQT